ncbi:MAG: hypothetical protein WC492_04410 [Candidatus Micrarchaeia archaeon]
MLAEDILSRLEILPLESLKIHEQTVEQNLTALRETMLNLGKLVDPLIVDRKHKIVLDGNHRRMVLELLKSENAVCQMVDYSDPSIHIGGWHIAAHELSFGKIKGESVSFEQGFDALQSMDASFMAIAKVNGEKMCKLIPSQEKTLDSISAHQEELIRSWLGVESSEKPLNGQVMFIEDNRAETFLDSGYTVLARKIFSKQEVIKEALAGRPLPPKSTRHMIPNRIIRLNFRLGYLNESAESASILLREMVKKRVKYGSARYYTEPVIVLY